VSVCVTMKTDETVKRGPSKYIDLQVFNGQEDETTGKARQGKTRQNKTEQNNVTVTVCYLVGLMIVTKRDGDPCPAQHTPRVPCQY
jgi:hypothetical protein